jgi:hypothetical protein
MIASSGGYTTDTHGVRIQGCHRRIRRAPGSDLVRHGPRQDDLGTGELQEVEERGGSELNERGCVDRWTLSQG